MLRKIKILAELKKRNSTLTALIVQKTGFETRRSELEKVLAEAETEEDINLVQQNIEDLEKEITDAGVDAKVESEQAEVEKLNAELGSIVEPTDPQVAEPKNDNERGAKFNMSKRGLFYTVLDTQQRAAFLENAEVKDFLTRARELKHPRGLTHEHMTIPQVYFDTLRPNRPIV